MRSRKDSNNILKAGRQKDDVTDSAHQRKLKSKPVIRKAEWQPHLYSRSPEMIRNWLREKV